MGTQNGSSLVPRPRATLALIEFLILCFAVARHLFDLQRAQHSDLVCRTY